MLRVRYDIIEVVVFLGRLGIGLLSAPFHNYGDVDRVHGDPWQGAPTTRIREQYSEEAQRCQGSPGARDTSP